MDYFYLLFGVGIIAETFILIAGKFDLIRNSAAEKKEAAKSPSSRTSTSSVHYGARSERRDPKEKLRFPTG
ncbi:hypothetical protein KJ575_05480 [Patescibacteria group bacterium]|nr:hypothetical protein [Patescibacteria group bacterium]